MGFSVIYVYPKFRNSVMTNKGLSTKDIKNYLNSSKTEILNSIKIQIDKNGTLAIMESHMFFPYAFANDLGLAFIFVNETDDYKPLYIVIDEETNTNEVNLCGAKPGMSFQEIKDKAGYSQVLKTWISSEDNIIYVLKYYVDGLEYSFVSYDDQGMGTELFIALSQKQ